MIEWFLASICALGFWLWVMYQRYEYRAIGYRPSPIVKPETKESRLLRENEALKTQNAELLKRIGQTSEYR